MRNLSLGLRLYEAEWDASTQNIIHPVLYDSRSACLEQAEAAIESCRDLFSRILQSFEEQGNYTVDDIADTYRSHTTPGNLAAYCRKQALLLKKGGRERTARAYLSSVRSLIAFNKGKPLALSDIDAGLLKDYERHLKDRGKSLNTVSFYMRNLRALYNKAVADNILPARYRHPFAGVYTGIDNTRKRALNIEEVGKLRQADIPGEGAKAIRLSRCRRLFFFSFYARGMSFIDLAYLRKDNIGKGVISYYRKKTGQPIEVKLTDEMKDIIDSFSKETRYSPYLFPIIRDKDKDRRLQYETALRSYNRDLKDLARLSGVNQPVSSHVARHSWATIAKYERLPLSLISEGLGHRNEKTTYIYLAAFERSRLDEANEMISHAITRVCAGSGGQFAFSR
ncbi:site-specific integrase [Dysgonomonas sp. 521]|nr:site-specific integrase [Dysgonomonas sp. 521]